MSKKSKKRDKRKLKESEAIQKAQREKDFPSLNETSAVRTNCKINTGSSSGFRNKTTNWTNADELFDIKYKKTVSSANEVDNDTDYEYLHEDRRKNRHQPLPPKITSVGKQFREFARSNVYLNKPIKNSPDNLEDSSVGLKAVQTKVEKNHQMSNRNTLPQRCKEKNQK